ncbi:glutathione S-transferase [Apiospora kogelbergensis]|uniref:glutathione S-transferase n=1 Tax=Apiospora kogelbergensis TaxID=1337665 RepID=UPI003132337E
MQFLTVDEAREKVTHWLGAGDHGHPATSPRFKHGDIVISQTPNLPLYLGPKLGLAGSHADDVYRVNAPALTALDGLSNEVHDSHHPITVMLPYEDQKGERRRRSQYWIQKRLPSHLEY